MMVNLEETGQHCHQENAHAKFPEYVFGDPANWEESHLRPAFALHLCTQKIRGPVHRYRASCCARKAGYEQGKRRMDGSCADDAGDGEKTSGNDLQCQSVRGIGHSHLALMYRLHCGCVLQYI